MTLLALAMGLATSTLLTRAAIDWEIEHTGALIQQHLALEFNLEALFAEPGPGRADATPWVEVARHAVRALPDVVRVKVWDRTAVVRWADDQRLIGQQFPENGELAAALRGRMTGALEDLGSAEHNYEREAFEHLMEIYVPILSRRSGEVVGVLEVYKTPGGLLATIHRGRILIWAISLAGGLVLYVVLLPLVRQVYGREVREEALRAQAGQLATRTRELEQALRDLTLRESRLKALLEVSRELARVQPVEALLQSIARACRHLLDVDSASIHLLEGDALVTMATWGEAERTVSSPRLRVGENFVGAVAATGEPLLVVDPVNDPRLTPSLREAYRERGVRGFLGVPLKTGDRVAGVLSLRTVRADGFSDEDLATARAFAAQAAVALESARLYQESDERRRRLATLVEGARRLTRRLDPDAVLESIAEAAAAVFEGEAGFRLLEGDELVRRGATPGARAAMARERLRVGESLSGRVAATGEPLVSEDTPADSRLVDDHRSAIDPARTGALLCVPLRLDSRILGTLHIFRERGYHFDEEALEMATALASQAATALENARLYRESRHAYDELSRAQDQFLQAQKMEAIGRLAGGVAHDFNNLMTVILGRSELLLSRLRPDDPIHRPLRLISTTAERAAALTQQLLAFSRKQMLQPKVLDLGAVVAQVDRMLRRLIGEDIELATVVGPGLRRVRADPVQLEQVILNLAVNARDAMPRGGRLALETVNVLLDQAFVADHPGLAPGPHVMLAVSDTGVGMDAVTQAHIFEPFFTTKDPGRGTGLGLATVHGIVKQHAGSITVESELGRGTTFRIYLPSVDESPERALSHAELQAAPTGDETVLLVEDEGEVKSLAREILQALGYTVLEAGDGIEALQLAAEHPGRIDLLITDVVMPRMGGPALADRLTRERAETRVLYVSGYAGDTLLTHGALAPGTVLLRKPFMADALARKVREVLDGSGQVHAAPGARAG